MDQRHLFSLDTVLDTRLATLSLIKPELAQEIIKDPEMYRKYQERPNDNFIEFGLEEGEFEKAYAKRNVQTLMTALPTLFLFEMADIATSLLTLQAQEPHNAENIEFVINMYPYTELTPAERSRILDAIGARLQFTIELSDVCVPFSTLGPKFITASRYTAVYFYDFREWMKHHYNNVMNPEAVEFMPGVSLYTRLIFDGLDKLKDAIEYQNPTGETCDPVLGYQVMFSPYFRLQTIRTDLYSVVPRDVVIKKDNL